MTATAAAATTPNVVPGQLLVKFAAGSTASERQATVSHLGGQIISSIPDLNVNVVKFAGAAAPAAAKELVSTPDVVYAEPNVILHAQFVPNDPDVTTSSTDTANQWALAKVNAFGAWDVSQGSPSTTIAVVDTGIDTNHPDLAGKVIGGTDLADSNNSFEDDNGHGTRVAGMAAADTNNGIGIAGMCPNCTLLAVKGLNASGSGTTATLAQAVTYAADQGARVLNLSFGGGSSATMDAAVEYAWGKGAFVSCAAGNSASSTPGSPAEAQDCFAVGATDSNDALASFSDFGTWVKAAAPGVSIISTNNSGGYSSGSGTSFSAPYVSGLAGLLAGNETNAAIRNTICSTADQIAGTGTDWTCGRIDAGGALASMAQELPVTTIQLTPTSPNGTNGWYKSLHLTVSGTATAGGATIDSIRCLSDAPSPPATGFSIPGGCPYGGAGAPFAPQGAHALYAAAEDSAGHVSSPVLASFKVDYVPPAVLCGRADHRWHRSNVSFGCIASDSTSGLANPAQSSFFVKTAVGSGHASSRGVAAAPVCDMAGNCTTAQVSGVKVDRKRPHVTIKMPRKGATYSVGSKVRIHFRCTDRGSGIATCRAKGALLRTSSAGTHSFTVVATDRAGNRTRVTRSYTVIHAWRLLPLATPFIGALL